MIDLFRSGWYSPVSESFLESIINAQQKALDRLKVGASTGKTQVLPGYGSSSNLGLAGGTTIGLSPEMAQKVLNQFLNKGGAGSNPNIDTIPEYTPYVDPNVKFEWGGGYGG